MDELSRLPRSGGLLLLGLALGLCWAAIALLGPSAAAHAEDDGPAGGGLLGVVTEVVPALTEVTEEVASAVQATNSASNAAVAALPPLGHLSEPVEEAVDAAVTPAQPTVDAVPLVLEPATDAVLAPLVDTVLAPALDAVEPVVGPVLRTVGDAVAAVEDRARHVPSPGTWHPDAEPGPPAHPALVNRVAAMRPVPFSAALAPEPRGASTVEVVASEPLGTHWPPAAEAPGAPATATAAPSAPTAALARIATAAPLEAARPGAAHPPVDAGAPPGPTHPTDTTPD